MESSSSLSSPNYTVSTVFSGVCAELPADFFSSCASHSRKLDTPCSSVVAQLVSAKKLGIKILTFHWTCVRNPLPKYSLPLSLVHFVYSLPSPSSYSPRLTTDISSALHFSSTVPSPSSSPMATVSTPSKPVSQTWECALGRSWVPSPTSGKNATISARSHPQMEASGIFPKRACNSAWWAPSSSPSLSSGLPGPPSPVPYTGLCRSSHRHSMAGLSTPSFK